MELHDEDFMEHRAGEILSQISQQLPVKIEASNFCPKYAKLVLSSTAKQLPCPLLHLENGFEGRSRPPTFASNLYSNPVEDASSKKVFSKFNHNLTTLEFFCVILGRHLLTVVCELRLVASYHINRLHNLGARIGGCFRLN